MREWPREVLETIKGPRTAPKKFSESFMRGVVSPWFRLNHRVNVSMRLAALAALMEQGNDLDNAARIVRETMFDFGDMTRFESRTLRRLIPFVSWLRNNTAYQAQLLFQRPVYAANYPRVVSAVEELINGEERVPDHMRPRWLRERLALQVGADPDSRFSLSLRDSIPTGAVYDVMAPITGPEGFMDFMRFFASSTAPGLRSIPEIGARREIFSGREIGPDATRGDISLPEYALGQIRPLRELGVGATRTGPLIRAAEQGPAAFLSRLTLGGRAQDFSAERMDRATLREFQNRDRELRIVIARAERYKNTALSRKSRAELLALYRAMVQAGHEEEVPRWAARQLAEFSR